jgi:hypothetical protein
VGQNPKVEEKSVVKAVEWIAIGRMRFLGTAQKFGHRRDAGAAEEIQIVGKEK